MVVTACADNTTEAEVEGIADAEALRAWERSGLRLVAVPLEELTGEGIAINTSFNVRGEPIVCTPEDAYHCFMGTDMDVLVLENAMLLKAEQPSSRIDREGYLFIEGRADDVIITSGYRIGPFEVESALLEHEAVAGPAAELERRGWGVSRVACDAAGVVDTGDIEAAFASDTALVAVMTAQNEIGTIQPVRPPENNGVRAAA